MTSEKWIQKLLDGNEYPDNVEKKRWDEIKEISKTDKVYRKFIEEWIKISVEDSEMSTNPEISSEKKSRAGRDIKVIATDELPCSEEEYRLLEDTYEKEPSESSSDEVAKNTKEKDS